MANSSVCRESGAAMGTFLQITGFSGCSRNVSAEVRRIFSEVERECSRFLPESALSEVNRQAGKKAVPVPEVLRSVLKEALAEATWTGGVFDPAIGAVTSLWNVGSPGECIPSEEERRRAEALVDYRKVELTSSQVFLKEAGMALDLGGAAKEYALHRAAEEAEKEPSFSGIIDAGGDLCTVGTKPDGSLWQIGIQHPRRRKTLLGVIALRRWNTAETSGDYRRYVMEGDSFQCHIFQKPGLGCGEPLASATLIYDRHTVHPPCGGAAFVAAGLEKSRAFLEKMAHVEAVLVTRDLDVWVTEGLADSFRLLDSTARKRALILHRM